MRIATIEKLKGIKSNHPQALYPAPDGQLEFMPPEKFKPTPWRAAKSRIGQWLFPVVSRQAAAGYPACLLPDVTHLAVGYRFTDGYPERQLRKLMPSTRNRRVLIPGCHYNSAEVREWMETDADSVVMLDIVDNARHFEHVKAEFARHYRPRLEFVHGTLEHLPLADQSVDLIYSRAVLEHVGNIEVATREMARVLKPGGLCLHGFGPLYFTHGGDHTISYHGFEHGYDHLLLDDEDYQGKISDSEYYERLGTGADHSRYWALQGIFSYLKPSEYLSIFRRHFELPFCMARLSPEAIEFRRRQPTAWAQLLSAGLQEPDLLIGGINVILRKSAKA